MKFSEYVNNYFGYAVDVDSVDKEELSFIWELYEVDVIEK